MTWLWFLSVVRHDNLASHFQTIIFVVLLMIFLSKICLFTISIRTFHLKCILSQTKTIHVKYRTHDISVYYVFALNADEKKLLAKWSNISSEDIRGWRTPFLYMGGDIQMEALTSSNMAYDSTRGALSDSSNPNLHWPFTQDYQDTETCPSGQCPECSWKGNILEQLEDIETVMSFWTFSRNTHRIICSPAMGRYR